MNKSNLPHPPKWGEDNITSFFEEARGNSFASFHNLKNLFNRLIEIDSLFRDVNKHMPTADNWFEQLFLLRAHSSFLCATQLASAGQMPETFMVLRGTIENALYGFYIFKEPNLAKTWLERHNDEKSIQEVKQQFQVGKIWPLLENSNKHLAEATKILYERAIDYGAHPNEKSILTILKMKEMVDYREFNLAYLSGDLDVIKMCLKSVAQAGVACLKIWEQTSPERFKLTQIDLKIKKLSEGL